MRRFLALALVIIGAFLLAIPLPAQEIRAIMSGRVVDASGAAIPNATITAINLGTGQQSVAPSTGDGSFNLRGPFAGKLRIARRGAWI